MADIGSHLDAVRVVLVNTSHPGNIGASARAMKTMGLSRLYLVSPRFFPNSIAVERASGAQNILERAVLCHSLEEAVAGCIWVAGFTTRPRRVGWPVSPVREGMLELIQTASRGEVALVFGRELSGLTNDELDYCHTAITIPTCETYHSLNLASAVQVATYELHQSFKKFEEEKKATPPSNPLATVSELEYFYAHFNEVLIEIGFLNPNNPRYLSRKLRRLFQRTQLEQVEVSMLRGILTEVQKAIKPRPTPCESEEDIEVF